MTKSTIVILNVNEHVPVDAGRPDGHQVMPITDPQSGDTVGYAEADLTVTAVGMANTAVSSDAVRPGGGARTGAIGWFATQGTGKVVVTTSNN